MLASICEWLWGWPMVIPGYFVFILVLMGMMVDFKNPKDEDGNCRFVAGHIFRYCFLFNAGSKHFDLFSWFGPKEDSIPFSLCKLYWGLFLGTLFFALLLTLSAIVALPALFFGRPLIIDYNKGLLKFHPLCRFGKDSKRKMWLTPAEACLTALCVLLVWMLLFQIGWPLLKLGFSSVVFEDIWYKIGKGILILCAGVWSGKKILKNNDKVEKAWRNTANFFIPIKEFLAAIYKEACPRITVVKKY